MWTNNKKQKAVLACSMVYIYSSLVNKKRRKRRDWTKTWLLQKHKYSHVNLLKELRETYPEDFRNYLRMNIGTFDILQNILRPHLTKQDTVMRNSIPPEERLMATLRFLATGRSYEDLKFSTGISAQALGYIIPETCEVIYHTLKHKYMQFPRTKEEWQSIAAEFKERWQLINCGGAFDGKHIRIIPPARSGAQYYNYKNFYSIILMALVNAKYEFIYVDVGKNGRVGDAGVFEQTLFHQALSNGNLNLPTCNETDRQLNFNFIGDEAFALGEHFLKPFPQKELSHERRIYNYRLSRARNVVENAFGLISSRFRILQTSINIEPQKINYVICAICVLHNFLTRHSPSYATNTSFDREDTDFHNTIEEERRGTGSSLFGLQSTSGRNVSNRKAKANRESYVKYFMGEGKVSWQEDMIRKGKS